MSEESEAIDRFNADLNVTLAETNIILLHSDAQLAFMVMELQEFNIVFEDFLKNYMGKIVDLLVDINENLDIIARTEIEIDTLMSYRNANFQLKAKTTTEI